MTEKPPRVVGRRHVVHISGFEPISVEGLDRRLRSGLRKFGTIWGAEAAASPPAVAPDGRVVTWDVVTRGPNWTTDCRYTVLRWDELMAPYVGRPWHRRVIDGYRALAEFARTGTVKRYFKANIRYGLFVIYPVLALLGFILLAVLAGLIVAWAGIPYAAVTGPIVAAGVFLLLLRFVGSYLYLDFALSDWAFAADLSRREVAGLDESVDRFRDEVLAAVRDSDAEEVIVSGVSLGAVMMVEALNAAYAAEPDLARHAPRATFLTVGSSLLKIGLHPGAAVLREAVGRIGGEPSLDWVEYQAKVDPINFYKTDPVADMGLPATGRPVVRNVRIRDMMSPEDYRRAQRNSLLFHRQFVMPNARRYYYDFYQICFGPLALGERVALGEKVVQAFGADGSYLKERPAGRRKAAMAAQK